jgi:hypothetical protein
MENFNLKKYLAEGALLKENEKKFNSARLIYKNDIDKFIKSNPALGSIYDEEFIKKVFA